MQSNNLFSTSLSICFISVQIIFAQSLNITVINDSDYDRADEIVEIELKKLEGILPDGNIESLGIVDIVTNKRLISQLVDSDGSGEYEYLIFQDNFYKGESKIYQLKYFHGQVENDSKVFVTFIEGREDIAWENDKVAFRMYGPPMAAEVDNGIDVWSKKVEYLIIDKWYKEESKGQSYHKDQGEGADFFSVGKSLGCGGSAIYLNDSLYQSGVYSNYKIIANGPIRLIFELEYVDFKVGDDFVTEKKIVTLDAGSYLNKVEAFYSDLPLGSRYTSGLVKRANTSVKTNFDNSTVSLWGDITKNKKDGLVGTAVIWRSNKNQDIVEDSTHILISSDIDDDNQSYYAGACWSKGEEIKTEDDWNKYLLSFAEKINSPFKVVLK